MKSSRIISVVLMLCMVICLFAACGETKNNGSSQTSAAEPTQKPEETAPAESGSQEPEEPDSIYPLTDEPVELSIYYSISPTILSEFGDLSEGIVYKAAAEITGVNLHFESVASDAYVEQFNLRLNGGTMCDIIGDIVSTYSAGIDAAVEDGVAVDLEQYRELIPNYYSVLTSDDAIYKDAHTDSGRLGCFYRVYNAPQRIRSGLMVRQDWMDALEMDTPVTYDDLHDVLTAFKTEYDAGMMMFSDVSFALSDGFDVQMYMYEGSYHAIYQVDGEVRFGPTQPEAREYLTMLHQWYDEGLIDPDNITSSVRFLVPFVDYASPVLNGKVGVMNSLAEVIGDWNNMTADENASFAGIPSPVRNEGDTLKIGSSIVVTSSLIGVESGMAVNADSDHIELAIQYLDFWFSEEGSHMADYGIEGVSFEYDENGVEVFTDLFAHNDTFSVGECKSVYAANNMSRLNNVACYDSLLLPASLEAYDAWASNGTNDYCISTCISLTADEATELSDSIRDLETYVAENMLAFVVGSKDIDSSWDEYVATIEGMGLDKCLAVYQAAFQRYQER